jgi:cytochrome c553
MMKTAILALFALAAVLSSSVHAGESAPEAYVPGMGEIMGATQMRHAKLWFAGEVSNWDLAQYELDEIDEGFSDAVAYHPTFKQGARIADILPRFVTEPVADLRKAAKAKDKAQFAKAFDRLTEGCNACHAATGNSFIKIKRPAPGLYSNQDFTARAE